MTPIASQPKSEVADDVYVVTRTRWRFECAAHTLHPSLAVGDRALRLRPARRGRQDDVGELGRLRQEDVLHDEVLETAEQANRSCLVRLAAGGVLTHDVQR